jgi:hypothetical protein
MIENYTILRQDNLTDLSRWVNEFIKEGWQPYGSMQVVGNNQYLAHSQVFLYQAMVKFQKLKTTSDGVENVGI